MKQRVILIILAAFLSGIILYPNPVQAQEDKPIWWHNLDCKKEEQRFSGIQYCTGKHPNEHFHVIVIQLDSPGIRVEYLLPDGIDKDGIVGECKDVNRSTKNLGGPGCDDPANRNWYPVFSLEQAVEKAMDPTLAVVINGDYSACTISPSPQDCKLDEHGNPTYRVHGPEGLTVVRGSRLDGKNNGDGDNNIVRRPWLIISEGSPLRAELHQFNSDTGTLPYDWVYTGIGGAPWLIQEGNVIIGAISSCENAAGSCYAGASQTAVGLTRDKRWMFLVLAVHADTLFNVAKFMDEKLDVWQAIKFDGGGSSQLYYRGVNDPYVEPGDGRLLTNFLAIHAEPGEGIFSKSPTDPTIPPVPPETPETPTEPDLSWWEKLQKSWADFWQKVNEIIDFLRDDPLKKIAELLDAWWQEQIQNLEDLVLQIFMDWLNQFCGTAWLVPTTVSISVFWRKRKRSKTKT